MTAKILWTFTLTTSHSIFLCFSENISLFHKQRQRRSDIFISRDFNLRKGWLGNDHFGWQTIRNAGSLAISRARDFRHRTYVMMRGTANRACWSSWRKAASTRKSCNSTARVISISSSEVDGSFQGLSSRQSSRSIQILTVTDMASLRGRCYEICITSGSI